MAVHADGGIRVQNEGKWFTGSENGRTNLHDDNRTEQASISRMDVNVARVEKLMLQNQTAISRDLSALYTKLLNKNCDTARCASAGHQYVGGGG
jgi:hypothetical protein